MALTRKMLKAMGIEDEKIDQIIDAHTETVDGLKADIEKYRTDAEKLPGVQKELETAQAGLEAGKKDSWKVKYDAIKEEFEGYKSKQTKKETRAAKESAYRNLLKATGINEKRIESVLKVSDVDSLELDDKGAIKDAAKLTDSIKTEWADFISTTMTKGAESHTPPQINNGKSYTAADIRGMSAAEINKNWDSIKASLNSQKG